MNIQFPESVKENVFSYDVGSRMQGMIHSEVRNGSLYHYLDGDMMISMLQYNFQDNVKICVYGKGAAQTRRRMTNKEMPYHRNDFIELSYVMENSITVRIESKEMTFSENELYLINPNVAYQEIKGQSDAKILNFSIRDDYFNDLFFANIHEDSLHGFLQKCLFQEKSSEQVLRFTPKFTGAQQKIEELIFNIFQEYKLQDVGYMFVIQGYLLRLFNTLAENYQFTFSGDSKNQYREYLFLDVKHYMYENCRDLSIRDLSEKFHYQSNYFNRLIQSYTGKSYSEYLIHIRVKEAARLLSETGMSIDEIMQEIGYHNKGFFYKAFNSEYGMTPAAYRKKENKAN